MKKTIITLMALTGVALGSDITLESQLISADGTSYGVYSQWEDIKNTKSLIEQYKTVYPSSLTFYVKVSDLFGADALSSTDKYQITSFSFLGQANGNNSGGSDTLTVTLGDVAVTGIVQQSTNMYTTVVFETPTEDTLSFSSTDILTLTLTTGTAGELVEMGYYDTYNTNKALGAASALNSDGTNLNYYHEYKNHTGNGWDKSVKTDAPIISMTVTKVVPEPTTATLSLLALAGLAARRRRK